MGKKRYVGKKSGMIPGLHIHVNLAAGKVVKSAANPLCLQQMDRELITLCLHSRSAPAAAQPQPLLIPREAALSTIVYIQVPTARLHIQAQDSKHTVK